LLAAAMARRRGAMAAMARRRGAMPGALGGI